MAPRPRRNSTRQQPSASGRQRSAPRAVSKRSDAPRTGRPGSTTRTRAPQTNRPRSSAPRGLGGTQVEGRHAVRELLLAGNRRVSEIFMSNELDQADIIDDIVELASDLKIPIREASRKAIDAMSFTEASQGVVAHAKELPEAEFEDLCSHPSPFLIAVDGITDPHNLGAILRTAECVGVTGMVLPRHRTVHITPTVTKTSAGAIEHVPMSLVGGLPSAIEAMKKADIWVLGLDAAADHDVHHMKLRNSGVCLVVGAEGKGLSRLVRQRCDALVSLPMRGQLGSLNAATAASVAMYEVLRSRDAANQAS